MAFVQAHTQNLHTFSPQLLRLNDYGSIVVKSNLQVLRDSHPDYNSSNSEARKGDCIEVNQKYITVGV